MKEPHWVAGYSSRQFRDEAGSSRPYDRYQRGADHPKGKHWIIIRQPPRDIYERLRTARALNYGFAAEGLVVNFRSSFRASVFVMNHDLEYILP